jgi:hypothetical protein
MGSTARVTQYQVAHFVRATILYNQANVANGIVVGTIPAGARITSVDVSVETAQNAGTTNTVSVGTAVSTNGVIAAYTAPTNLVNAAAAGAAAFTKTNPTSPNQIAATDLAIIASLAQTGTAATAGSVTVWVTYVPNL